MIDERDYLAQCEELTDENIDKILGLFQTRYLFITDEADLEPGEGPISIFIVPLNQYDFRYATQEEYNYWRTTDITTPQEGMVLSKYEYFSFIKGLIRFTEDLSNIELNI